MTQLLDETSPWLPSLFSDGVSLCQGESKVIAKQSSKAKRSHMFTIVHTISCSILTCHPEAENGKASAHYTAGSSRLTFHSHSFSPKHSNLVKAKDNHLLPSNDCMMMVWPWTKVESFPWCGLIYLQVFQ